MKPCAQVYLPAVACAELHYSLAFVMEFMEQVINSDEEISRLLLCEATATIMRECFKLLGITPLYRL
jgi:arginyl-tRNA synthetase